MEINKNKIKSFESIAYDLMKDLNIQRMDQAYKMALKMNRDDALHFGICIGKNYYIFFDFLLKNLDTKSLIDVIKKFVKNYDSVNINIFGNFLGIFIQSDIEKFNFLDIVNNMQENMCKAVLIGVIFQANIEKVMIELISSHIQQNPESAYEQGIKLGILIQPNISIYGKLII